MKKHFFKIGLLALIIIVCIWMQIKARERGEKNFERFYATEINSTLEIVNVKNHGTGITLKDGKEFVFYPYTDKVLNDNKIFNYTAEKGDSVIKPAYSDTLFLIKKGERLVYLFQKL